jgi:succinylglutamate desuccinylase
VPGEIEIMSNSIRRVAIVGGTHGNEWTGIYLVKKFEQFPELIVRSSFETITLLGNPKAIAANRRYIDQDLNRCFFHEDLLNPALTSYEGQRAKMIAAQLGPKENPQVDFIIDLHSSTANMGLTILPSSADLFNLRLCAYLSQIDPAVRVTCGIAHHQDTPMLRSLSSLGCTIEVGAVAQGVLDARYFQETEILVHRILDYLDATNHDNMPAIPERLTIYQSIASIDYPRNTDGEVQAAIHPQRQFQDYAPLRTGDPLFMTFAGEAIAYQGKSPVFPIFINEAAYYEKGIAMTLTEKQELEIEPP